MTLDDAADVRLNLRETERLGQIDAVAHSSRSADRLQREQLAIAPGRDLRILSKATITRLDLTWLKGELR